MEPINLNYSVNISEASTENGDFIIQGTAINACTTDNGHRFLVEELRPAAKGMAGIPLLVDHDALVANIKGRVQAGTFNESEEKVDFKAKVMDKVVQEMIKDGRLNSVSIGANVKEIEENDDGTITARGIKIKELSLVAVPADDGATFAIAMSEAFNSMKDKKDDKSNLQDMKGGLSEKMEENDNAKVLEAIDAMGKSFSEKLEAKIDAVEKSFSEKLEAMKESDADEEAAEESKEEESKEEAEEKSEEESKEEESKEEAEEESEDEEEDKAEEGSKLDIVEGNGTLRGNSFSYNW